MPYPFGAVGQFAVGSVPVFGDAVDLAIPASSSVSSAPAGNIVVGVTLNIPASSSVSAAPAGNIAVGVTLDIPASSSVSAAPPPEIDQSVNLVIPASSSVSSAPIPNVDAGASIMIASQITMVSHIGPPGIGPVGLYAVGDGPQSSRVVLRVPQSGSNIGLPLIQAGASMIIGATASNSNSPVGEIDARRRKLRIMAIAS